ncbi:hypothetical protein BDN72DRAFT_773774 [Pluteus cervinus]|uniref:Uncharacterized protein n=1 Tax=Pluteus cervinus TaxID=181527 RepID=A0ACD3AHP1_9AGAR|nr:hypothetical protein BDN72DRAFT_773774 [Pluteus cervinus]
MSEAPQAASDPTALGPATASDVAVVIEDASVAPQVEATQDSQFTLLTTAGVEREETAVEADNTVTEEIPSTPQVALTFLLVTGRRRTMVFEPETAIGRVKELVWNTWPADWQDERPPAPSYLRVLYLGKMLQDDETLTS